MPQTDLTNAPRVFDLPNSTYIIKTKVGSVLVNCPPETLKYISARGFEIPEYILLPPDIPAGIELGSSGFVRKGINYASVEFLLYANFFIKSRRALIFTPSVYQAMRLNLILQETFEGPTLPEHYMGDEWLYHECRAISYFPPMGRAPDYTDLCDIRTVEEEGILDLGDGVKVEYDAKNAQYIFREEGQTVAMIPTSIHDTPRPLSMAESPPVITRRQLTLQFLGGSDGFDPNGITTCFLAYLSRENSTQATLFDTAAFLRMRLGNLGVSASQISEVVISHLHEDHIAGLPEILLMGNSRIKILTSDIIYKSLLRVLGAMIDLPADEVASLFDYEPVNPGNMVQLGDRTFESLYAVHSIPTIAMRVNGLYYSGDMRYDESFFADLVAKKVLTDKRRHELIDFGDGADILVQDAGGGTIHTTVTPELLTSLARKGQKVILAHTRDNPLPEIVESWKGRVELATSGHITSIGEMHIQEPHKQVLSTLRTCPILRRLPDSDLAHLEASSVIQYWNDGEEIMRDGVSIDDQLYVVHSGLVEIWKPNDGDLLQIVGRGNSFGERAILSQTPTLIDDYTVIAKGDTQILRIGRDVFTPLANQLRLTEAMSRAEWLKTQPLFRDLLWSILLDLSLDLHPRQLQAGESLFNQGDVGRESFLLISGKVEIKVDNERVNILDKPGTFFGGRSALFDKPRTATGNILSDAEIWVLPPDVLLYLHDKYPNISLHLRAVEFKLNSHLSGMRFS